MLQNRYIVMLLGGIIGAGLMSILIGEIQWGLFVGIVIGVSIAEWLTRRRESKNEVETDERVKTNMLKFTGQALGLANFLLFIYLVLAMFVLDQQFIEIRYLIDYLLVIFLITLFIGPAIIKRK